MTQCATETHGERIRRDSPKKADEARAQAEKADEARAKAKTPRLRSTEVAARSEAAADPPT
eukprot:COSAG05_NODE_1125_length_5794_cov_6.018450_4_plen_61_part_00